MPYPTIHRRPRPTLPLATIVAVGLMLSAACLAHEHGNFGLGYGDDGDFNWSIVTADGRINTTQLDSDLLDNLKARYGTPFLVVGEGSDRYVITDKKLVERAQKSALEIQKYGREIGELAGAEAKLSLGDTHHEAQMARINKQRKTLEEEIRSGETDRERLDQIEDELFQLKVELQALRSMEKSNALTSEERADLKRQRDLAKEKLQVGIDRINKDMREILEIAKERNLAKKID